MLWLPGKSNREEGFREASPPGAVLFMESKVESYWLAGAVGFPVVAI